MQHSRISGTTLLAVRISWIWRNTGQIAAYHGQDVWKRRRMLSMIPRDQPRSKQFDGERQTTRERKGKQK